MKKTLCINNKDNKSPEAAKESRVEHKELEGNNKKDRDLIGEPVILRQRRWFRSPWTNGDGNRNNGRGYNVYQEGMWSKKREQKQQVAKKWEQKEQVAKKWEQTVQKHNNWNMKKSACAVENIDKDRQTTKDSTKESQMINNTAKNTMRKTDTEESIKWNEKLNRLQEAITGLEKIIAQKGIVAQLSPVL